MTTLYSFTGNNDGEYPQAVLVQGSDGNFYGTTYGWSQLYGSRVFKITPSGVLTTLHNFTGGSDGAQPMAGLVQGRDGNFYGTTEVGGSSYLYGTVFKITPSGDLTTLHSFDGYSDGGYPMAGLVQGSDGNFYGTTSVGGPNEDPLSGYGGTVFKITTNGALTSLYNFTGNANGGNPEAGLVQGSDGNFYGTTSSDGAGYGTVFKITPNGVLTTLHSFTGDTNGGNPTAGLVQGSDGNFYGTTSIDGAGYGTVFKITTNGVLTTLYSFTGYSDGWKPSGLVQGSDGNFYGTTAFGSYGQDTGGTVFEITTNGVLTTLYSFNHDTNGWPNGEFPDAGLVQGSDGNLYGTTCYNSPPYCWGTVFRLILGTNQTVTVGGTVAGGAAGGTAVVVTPRITTPTSQAGTSSFNIVAGVPGTYWNVYESSNLVNWTLVGGVTLDASGNGSFTHGSVSGGPCRFYKLGNGE